MRTKGFDERCSLSSEIQLLRSELAEKETELIKSLKKLKNWGDHKCTNKCPNYGEDTHWFLGKDIFDKPPLLLENAEFKVCLLCGGIQEGSE